MSNIKAGYWVTYNETWTKKLIIILKFDTIWRGLKLMINYTGRINNLKIITRLYIVNEISTGLFNFIPIYWFVPSLGTP